METRVPGSWERWGFQPQSVVETLVGFISPDLTRAPFSSILCFVLRSLDATSVDPKPCYNRNPFVEASLLRFRHHEAGVDIPISPGRRGGGDDDDNALERDAGLGDVG